MIQIKPGEIHIVDFGSTHNHSISGRRPALILYRDRLTFIVIPITNDRHHHYHETEIPIYGSSTGLKKDSKLKLGQIHTVDVKEIHKKIGNIATDQLIIIIDFIKTKIIDIKAA
jgi:mRNA-degrading endonuclease toxin of MazEF toxin-antitoxin module